MLSPVVNDVTITPIANDEADTIAIAASLFILPFSANLSKKKAAIITIGIENLIGANPKAIAMDNAPNETCDKPSPIIEYLFKTRLTPKRAAQSDTNTPPIKALCINPWANISLIICYTSQKHI